MRSLIPRPDTDSIYLEPSLGMTILLKTVQRHIVITDTNQLVHVLGVHSSHATALIVNCGKLKTENETESGRGGLVPYDVY